MGLATPKIAKSILAHIKNKKIAEPYPCRAIDPPLKPGSPAWHDYFENCDARTPYDYLNGGVWPFIGGFYIAALVKNGQLAQAKIELEKLAKANLKVLQDHNEQEVLEAAKKHGLNPGDLLRSRTTGFNEWLDGKKGVPKGEPYQGWSAGAYVFAYHCVQDNAVWYFDYD
jgi:glycogen debranching enzyme